ncbi:Ger(x)C family spore germination protein [Paenibacillus terrigena]|uniref:Ger(x)C family spore germination protein n=1 Tax=Paenibacillus terrigena TaxID=369333 RepID=UPI0028D04B4A|nr:Ger(x)C family spore germination protein [Paenibacillus terrigena]
MKKITGIIVLLLACSLISGCWNRIELNELSIVSASSFDFNGNKWVNSYQVIIPSAISSGTGLAGGGGSQSPVTVFSSEGRTIREAVGKSSMESPRQMFFAHNSALIISEEVARHGINEILDLHYRNTDARETVNVLITQGNARSILERLIHTEKIPGQGIRGILSNESRNTSIVPSVMLYELAMAITSDGKGAVIPEIVFAGNGEDGRSLDVLKKTYEQAKLRIGRLAVLRGDKFAGWLTREEGLGVSFIANKVRSTNLAFRCKPGDKNYNMTFRLQTSATKLKPTLQNGKMNMGIDIKGAGYLLESNCVTDLTQPAAVKQLEQQLQEEVKQMVIRSWGAAKRLKVDVFGFADAVHRKYPREWRRVKNNWDETFSKIQIEPHIKISMDRVGLTSKTFKSTNSNEKR